MAQSWIVAAFVLAFAVFQADGQITSAKMDLVFVLDGSGSVVDHRDSVWEQQLGLITRILRELNVSPNSVRVAVVTFADEARVRWHLDRYVDANQNINAVKALNFTGGKSNIQAAMDTVRQNVFGGGPGDRPDARNVAIIFTDGKSTIQYRLTETSAEDLKSKRTYMFSIALGSEIDPNALKYLSTSPDYRFHLSNLTESNNTRLIYSSFIARLLSQSSTPIPLQNPCDSSPCMNGGICNRENPYGWRYSCHCPHNSGGRLCQWPDPCIGNPCPLNTRLCYRSSTKDNGRYCYDRNFQILENDLQQPGFGGF